MAKLFLTVAMRYDYCHWVLTDYPDDEKLYKEFIEEWRNKFKNANNVAIVGVGIGETVFFCFFRKNCCSCV